MNDLKKKMFFSLFGALSALALSLSLLIGFREYASAQEEVRNDLMQVSNLYERLSSLFMAPYGTDPGVDSDSEKDWIETYRLTAALPSVIFRIGKDGTITQILSLRSESEETEKTVRYAARILSSSYPGMISIGNLYTDQYAWYYAGDSSLVVSDVSSVRKALYGSLFITLFLLALFEMIFWIVCRKAAVWMTAPIEKAFEQQKQFVADASHELKTPLAVIMASAEAMEQDGNHKWLHNIEEEAGRMNRLITDLLDLTRSEQENMEVQRVDLTMIVEKQSLIQEAVIFEHDLTLEEDIQEDVFVDGHESALTQVVAILLDNAIAHSTSMVKISLRIRGKECILTVSNTGKPIPEEEREKIFERFYRGDQSRTRSSGRYGLGLAIARNIVERHHGSINVECANGITSFSVCLPLASDPTRKNAA